MKERIIQLITAAVLSIGGLALLFTGVLIEPQGEIHESLLVAFGEVATFAGSIMGIDYYYKIKNNYDTNHPHTPEDQRPSSHRHDDLSAVEPERADHCPKPRERRLPHSGRNLQG